MGVHCVLPVENSLRRGYFSYSSRHKRKKKSGKRNKKESVCIKGTLQLAKSVSLKSNVSGDTRRENDDEPFLSTFSYLLVKYLPAKIKWEEFAQSFIHSYLEMFL